LQIAKKFFEIKIVSYEIKEFNFGTKFVYKITKPKKEAK